MNEQQRLNDFGLSTVDHKQSINHAVSVAMYERTAQID